MSTLSIGGVHGGSYGANLGVQFDLQGALAVSRNLGILEASLGKFQQRAIVTVKRRIGPEARRDAQREYNIKAKRFNKDLRVSTPAGGLRITGYFRGIGLRNFGHRERKRGGGVYGSVFKGKGLSFYRGAFEAPLLGDPNHHVVERFGPKRRMTAGNYIGQTRQPLVVEYGPTVAQMLRKGARPQRLADFALGILGAEMTRQIESHLRRRAAATSGSPA